MTSKGTSFERENCSGIVQKRVKNENTIEYNQYSKVAQDKFLFVERNTLLGRSESDNTTLKAFIREGGVI
jgi:hypothetical protein